MKHFATAILAAIVSAETFGEIPLTIDGSSESKYAASKEWSGATFNSDGVTIDSNNSLFLKNSKSSSEAATFQPDILGGSIEYKVNVSNIEAGCVAGFYLVETDTSRCSDNAQDAGAIPQCRSIDMMQANREGFETKAHPCGNGTCDAVS
jgi:hypothetical protein|mmetsp:Transcript_23508/g.31511  ORF Transcript_23508/g.31511 Transcript_23508/m.31511 type:complete len:150 (-) Transcript_23508:985-1434(-)